MRCQELWRVWDFYPTWELRAYCSFMDGTADMRLLGQAQRTLVPTEIAVAKVSAFSWASSASHDSPGQQQEGQVTRAHTQGCIPKEEPWIRGTWIFSYEELACCPLLHRGRPSLHSKALCCTDILEQIGQNKGSQHPNLQNRQKCRILMEIISQHDVSTFIISLTNEEH